MKGKRLYCPTDLQLDFNWVVKSNPVLFQECQDVIPALFMGGVRQSRTLGKREEKMKRKEVKKRKWENSFSDIKVIQRTT